MARKAKAATVSTVSEVVAEEIVSVTPVTVLTDAEIEEMFQAHEAWGAEAEVEAVVVEVEAEEAAEDDTAAPLPLMDIVAAVSVEEAAVMSASVNTAFDERGAYEALTNPANDTIQDKLKGYRGKLTTPGIIGLMVATNIDAAFLNRSMNEGKRFNVYSVDKLADLLHGINSGHMKNAINIAVMKSLFKFRAAGMAFTGLAAQAAASDKVKVEKGMTALLVRHTVAAGTAPTQSSSTMNALSVLGVVVNKGSQKFPLWELTDAPVVERLRVVLAA